MRFLSPRSKSNEDNSPEEYHFEMIPVNQIQPDAQQPRQLVDPSQQAKLAKSVQEHGILEPLVVRQNPQIKNSYILVCGHKRWKAALESEMEKIPCVIRNFSEMEAFEMGMLENLARGSLCPLDEAFGYKRLLQEGLIDTQRVLARRLGVSESRISQMLHITELPEPVIQEIRQKQEEIFEKEKSQNETDDGFRISERHLREVMKLNQIEDQLALVHGIFQDQLSVTGTEKLMQALANGTQKPETNSRKPVKNIPSSPDGTKVSLSKKQLVVRISHENDKKVLMERINQIQNWINCEEILEAFFAPEEDSSTNAS